MSEAIVALVLKAAVVKGVEVMLQRVLNSNWSKNFENAKELLSELESEWPRQNYLIKHVQYTLKMRTLLNPNDDVMLDDVYYPLTLVTASHRDKIIIGDNESLKYSGISNIIGIAGQGKSTVLRKLFLEEINNGCRIPFFIELRNVEDGDILVHFKTLLRNLNLTVTDSNVEYLLQSGKIVLLLDGFDEVRQQLTTRTLNSIKLLNGTYACPLIITSRPNTDICTAPGINNLFVENINLEDKIRILNLIEQRDVNSNGTTFRHLCGLLISRESFADTICNPIMVTLLYHCFPYMDEVPSDISEFYRQLFGVLYARHDKTKGYNSRERESEVTVEPARELFSYISLKSLLQEEYELDSYTLHQYVSTALKTKGYDVKNADAFINDIVKITCLLQADGNDRYVYLHKSVQEFFAAFYLSIMKEVELKSRIYKSLREKVQSSETFDNFLHFLFHLDNSTFIDELTLETFRECQYKDYADLSYHDFSIPFDRILKDVIIRGQSKQDDPHIKLISHTSMSRILNMGFLDVINGSERTYSHEIDMPLINSMEKGIEKENLDSVRNYLMPQSTPSNKSGIVNTEETSNPTVNYAFPLIDYLHFKNLHDVYKKILFDKIKNYNNNIYMKRYTDSLKRKSAIDDSFDFL
ncbi:NACHT domain-containing protein [Pectobacterium brasiliense]|uniref:NACHT domain-containing protein n=1 Tax=Pectobacterium brasiliense TaxID=180957 RepID=UPI0019692BA3|nr:NACHT domain-containing protein [Pectobacterium brasiliense]MBN3264812.1 NACHT domain-containing protein [Pectobacterium brasiliense]